MQKDQIAGTLCDQAGKPHECMIDKSKLPTACRIFFFGGSRINEIGGKIGYCNLQPTGARRAFPCWDEPTLRATFDITLVVPKDRIALSNMVSTDKKNIFIYPFYRFALRQVDIHMSTRSPR